MEKGAPSYLVGLSLARCRRDRARRAARPQRAGQRCRRRSSTSRRPSAPSTPRRSRRSRRIRSHDGGDTTLNPSSYGARLGVILAAGALLRLWAILAIPTRPVSDFFGYFEVARNLVATGRYETEPGVPDGRRSPAYPVWLSLAFARGAGRRCAARGQAREHRALRSRGPRGRGAFAAALGRRGRSLDRGDPRLPAAIRPHDRSARGREPARAASPRLSAGLRVLLDRRIFRRTRRRPGTSGRTPLSHARELLLRPHRLARRSAGRETRRPEDHSGAPRDARRRTRRSAALGPPQRAHARPVHAVQSRGRRRSIHGKQPQRHRRVVRLGRGSRETAPRA